MRVAIIGSGFGGLATAIRLLAHGHEVTIYEQRDAIGGRAYTWRQDGFVFDGGPTVITAPWMLQDLFRLAGKRLEDHLDLVRLDPFYRIFFDDGACFDYRESLDDFEQEIVRLTGSDADIPGYRRFLKLSERIFDKGFTQLAARPFLRFTDMLRIAPSLLRLESYRTVHGLLSRYVKDDRLRQIMTFHPLLIGGNPFHTTSIYALIHHLEREWGVWYVMGGTGHLVGELARLIEDMGGRIETSTEVKAIETAGRKATHVRLHDHRLVAVDAVVSNADVANTYRRLLAGSKRRRNSDRRYDRVRYAMSLVVIYFGTNRRYRDDLGNRLKHHNIILGPRYRGLLQDIFEHQRLADDMSLYLHMPTLTDPSLAPPDGDAFYVLAPVPHLTGRVDWQREARPFRDRIMQLLEDRYLPDLSRHLVTERMIDPRHFEQVLGSYRGSAFAIEPILTQSAWFRPHNRSEDFSNVFLVGAGTHPGAGVPGVLSSALIAEDLVQAYERSRKD